MLRQALSVDSGLWCAVYSAFSHGWKCLCRIGLKDETLQSCALKISSVVPNKPNHQRGAVPVSSLAVGSAMGPFGTPLRTTARGVKEGLCLVRLKAKVVVPRTGYSSSRKISQAFQGKLLAFISGAWPVLPEILNVLLCFDFYLYCAGDVHVISVCAVLPGSLPRRAVWIFRKELLIHSNL